MKNKAIKILFIFSSLMLLSGCGKEETVFDKMSFEQTPINVSNPITDPEVEDSTIVVEDESRNLYYERYEPSDTYVPSQIANTSYSLDENKNEIPNGLVNFDFNRQSLRTLDSLISDYNIAEEDEYKWVYLYAENDKTLPRNYFKLTKTLSLIGKDKGEESLNFDDLVISRFYDYTNSNTIEDLDISIKNKGKTSEVTRFSKELLSLVLSEDFKSILMNSPNTSDSDVSQIYSGSILTDDGQSSYNFYREFKTPLKESAESVSASFNVKFLDNYTQKAKGKSTIINNQNETIGTKGIDFGFLTKARGFNDLVNEGPLSKYAFNLPETIYKKGSTQKEYDILKTFTYDNSTNLDPADNIVPIERKEYLTKVNYFGKYKDIDKEYKTVKLGTIDLDYKYEKKDSEFTSLYFKFVDNLEYPKEGIAESEEKGTFNIDNAINDRVQMIFQTVDIGDEVFYTNYNKSTFAEINGMNCKVTVKITNSSSGKTFGVKTEVTIESPDIYTQAEYDIVSENSEIEYDLEGNIINKDSDDDLSNEDLEEVDKIFDEDDDLDEKIEDVNEKTTENIEDSTTDDENNDNELSGGSLSDFF